MYEKKALTFNSPLRGASESWCSPAAPLRLFEQALKDTCQNRRHVVAVERAALPVLEEMLHRVLTHSVTDGGGMLAAAGLGFTPHVKNVRFSIL